ncbi:TIGR01666 family membrane protein [Oceanisphaera profunda]|uniref:TIGR01666 family membrane protein n=1 Tax=Oceanisphaera profunda TaxID=1416627 RepID=A0A1Y0D2I7_9GAMM|nr:YccS family putative transporter [Oceanisphaera profunda]ART81437.1 TIGR01666 family membrane protein [Oceanisphaera profunda]
MPSVPSRSALIRGLKSFVTNSHVFLALKVLLAMASILLVGLSVDRTTAAVTLVLGVMAGALSEVDQNPKGRLLHLLVSLCCFFIAITLVTLLIPYPWAFGPLLVLGTLVLMLMAAWGHTKGTLGFGILLVSLYAMQGHADSPSFWYQPLLLTLGAAWYGLLSWLILVFWPYKQVHEQLAQCYFSLSRYLVEKSHFFDSPQEQHQALRHQLAQINIGLVSALEHTKRMLNRRLKGANTDLELHRLLALYLLVQDMHERAASSHYSYQQLNQDLHQDPVLQGYQVLLTELGQSCATLGQAILSHNRYQHSKRISWELSALQNQIDYRHLQQHYSPSLVSSMRYLGRNIGHLHQALLRGEALTQPQPLSRDQQLRAQQLRAQQLNDRPLHAPQLDEQPLSEPPVELAQVPRQAFWPKLKALLHPDALLFRHCIRLCACFALGYGVISYFELARGYWILLTILFVCQPSFSATRQRLVQRTLGTLGGILVAVPLLAVFPSVGAQVVILLLCAFVFFTQTKVHYSWAVGFVTLFVLLAFNLQGGASQLVWQPRLFDTLLGCALAFVAVWCIWPDWQQRHLPRLMAEAMDANADYLAAIAKQFSEGRVDHLDYRLPRKHAHLADNQLALAWQHIRVEPVAKYWLNVCFDIAYRNHALLSYLSALGAHRSQNMQLLAVQEQQIHYLVQQLHASARALRCNVPLPLPLNTVSGESSESSAASRSTSVCANTPATAQQEWQCVSQQLLTHIGELVDDLYQLAESFPHTHSDTAAPDARVR